MQEVEIKFFIQPSSLKAVSNAVSPPGSPRRQRLRAQYFDTPDRDLATRRAALRLRLEGRAWVQTFKMAGDHVLERIELNHPRPGPSLDLSVYADTPAQAVIEACGDRLAVRYETDVLRATRLIKTRGGSVELAFDSGEIRAGGQRWPIQELEFELKSGGINSLFDLAHRWVRDHDLVLDLRSKSERGDGLASLANGGQTLAAMEAAVWPKAPTLEDSQGKRATWGYFLQTIAGSVETLFRNTAALARFGTELPEGGGEHAAALFKVLVSWDAACRLFPDVAQAGFVDLVLDVEPLVNELRPYLRSHIAATKLEPLYEELGLAPALRSKPVQLDLRALLSARDFQAWQLTVLAWLLGCGSLESDLKEAASLDKLLRRLYPSLKKWQKNLYNRLAAYGALSSTDKFKVRRTLERLDHSAFLLQGVIKPESHQRIAAVFQDILERLAQLEALSHTMLRWRGDEQPTPQIWFALGWATAKQAALVQDVQTLAEAVRRLDWRR